MPDENKSALKHLFGKTLLRRLSDSLGKIYPPFDKNSFLSLMPSLEKLEMKPRVHFLRDELRRQLPADYKKALVILRQSAKDGTLSGFDLWPCTEFVQTFGLDNPQMSLEALRDFTKIFTSEWAVRPFLKRYPKETLLFLEACARDKNEHLRRWASEGTRPKLPWGERLQDFVKDPKPTLPILEILKFDSELYVRKSVANHLNDISKDHPEYVVKLLRRWSKDAGEKHRAKVDWIIRHSLRTLIKEGHPGALQLIGVSKGAQIELVNFKIHQKKIKLGERFDFEFEIKSLATKPQKLVVDYIVHFVKSNKSRAPKVFKLKRFELPPKTSLKVKKSHHIKKITTREYYPGEHFLEIQVNGVVVGKQVWKLLITSSH